MSDLNDLVVRLKSGEYNGTDIMNAWIAIEELQAARESEGGEAAECPSAPHEQTWHDYQEGFCAHCGKQEPLMCTGKHCSAVNGVGHSAECEAEHAATVTPQPDKWISCSERLPTELDGYVWICYREEVGVSETVWSWYDVDPEDGDVYWMPTGLTRPAPPEQELE